VVGALVRPRDAPPLARRGGRKDRRAEQLRYMVETYKPL